MLDTSTMSISDNLTYAQSNSSLNSTSENLDEFEWLEPNRDPLYVVIPVTIIYVVIFLTGVIGNVSTCIVISRNKSMHTATNYYLYSLAISDLLLLITGLPQEIYSIWSKYPYVFGEVFCVIRGLAAETSANATVLTITAFTIERYVAICHPFLSHTMSKLSRAIKLILLIWIVALGFAMPQALQFGIVFHNGIAICTQKRIILEHSFEISTFLFFVTPMTLITVLYVLIGLRLRSSNMMTKERGNGGLGTRPLRTTPRANSSRRNAGQSSRRVLKMLVAVVVAFFICWAPFHAQRLVAIYGTIGNHQAISPTMLTAYMVMTYISGVLYYLSTTVNPVLYHIMSHKFREAFKETLARCWGGGDRRSYHELARSRQLPRFGLATQDSTDYSGNSVREESLTSGGLQLYDTVRISRGRRSTGTPSNIADPAPNSFQYTSVNGKAPPASDNVVSSYGTQLSYPATKRSSFTNVTYRADFPSSVHIHFNDKEADSRLCNPVVKDNDYKLRSLPSETYDIGQKTTFWYIFKCVSVNADKDKQCVFPAAKARLTVETETQTDTETLSMVPCNISNSSLRDVDRGALEDELTSYMEEIHRREGHCNLSQIKT